MWTVVYMSQDRSKVDRILTLLDEHKIMTMQKSSGDENEDKGLVYEILVPQTELETAQDLIFDAEMEN